MRINIQQKGDFAVVTKYLNRVLTSKERILQLLNKYGQQGVEALRLTTPKDTGLTAKSWEYEIEMFDGYYRLSFYNTNIQNGIFIAVLIYHGHATRNGYWVDGVDYITPALRPLFDEMAEKAWKEVTSVE